MLLSKPGCHPDYGSGVSAGGVGDELTEMRVVGQRELVLHNQRAIVSEINADQVEKVIADLVLPIGELDLEPGGDSVAGSEEQESTHAWFSPHSQSSVHRV